MTSRPGVPPPGPAGGCPDSETLAGLALGECEPDERRLLADHVVGCPACTADFRLLRELHQAAQVAAPRRRRAWLSTGAAAGAVAAVATVLLLWPGRLAERSRGELRALRTANDDAANRLAEAQRRLAERESELASLRRDLESAALPSVNVPIVDLEPGPVRGASDEEAWLRAMPGASWVTAVLAVAGGASADEHTLDIRDAAGRTVWRGGGLVRNDFGSFTIAIPSRLLPAGRYRFILSRASRGGATHVVQTYQLVVASGGP